VTFKMIKTMIKFTFRIYVKVSIVVGVPIKLTQ